MRSLPYRAPLTITLIALAIAFFLLGLRGLVFPGVAAATLGVPTASPDGFGLMQTTAARNLGLSLLAISMIIFDQRRALAGLLFAAALISILDFAIVWQINGLTASIKHIGYFCLLGTFGLLTFVRPRDASYPA